MTRAASVGLIVYALTVSLAGVDWMESLEPDFHSSIYGLLFLSFFIAAAGSPSRVGRSAVVYAAGSARSGAIARCCCR